MKLRHRHESEKSTHFYHEESSGQGTLNVMFEVKTLDDGRRLVFPTAVNFRSMPTYHDWLFSSPLETESIAERVQNVLEQSRMVLKPAK